LAAAILASALSGSAQVEKTTMRTTGISCGVCAAVSEFKFRRMPGVDHVTISLPDESITISYKPGAAFSPQLLRQTLEPLSVRILEFRITARGRLQKQTPKPLFVAGKDTFALQAEKTMVIPTAMPVRIEGILDDQIVPMALKALSFAELPE
jgi:hypothetical protein